MKTIGTPPGAVVFRSTVAIVIILICISSFLVFTSKLSQQAEVVAKDWVIVEVKQALAMMLYDYAIKGQLNDLQNFDRENPFVPLAIYRELPKNYRGTINSENQIKEYGWYFDLINREMIYKYSDDDLPVEKYLMIFIFEDLGKAGKGRARDFGHLIISRA